MASEQITVDYFSDILCIWAWITQRRIDELNKHFGDKIEIRNHYMDVFGDTATRIEEQWCDQGLYNGFADHVINSASAYESVIVSSDIWYKTRPATSANAHMVIKAVELSNGKKLSAELATTLRKAFFLDASDIGNLEVIFDIAGNLDVDLTIIKHLITNGEALAALMCDYQHAKQHQIKGSPCFVMNEGRQVLFGNVGYRVLRANIEELLGNSRNNASWC